MTQDSVMYGISSMNVMRILAGTNELPRLMLSQTSNVKNTNDEPVHSAKSQQTVQPQLQVLRESNSRQSNYTNAFVSAPIRPMVYDCNNRVYKLLLNENQFHVDATSLLNVETDVEDKVDALLRDDALSKLRTLHAAYYDLTPVTFCKTICLVNSFVTRIKVKPKYMLCVTAACYYIASKFDSSTDAFHPTRDNLVRLYRCGGSKVDLSRMIDIILSKLGASCVTAIGANNSTPVDFLEAFIESNQDESELDTTHTSYKMLHRKLETVLCSTKVSKFRPSCIALAMLRLYGLQSQELKGAVSKLRLSDLFNLANVCRVDWSHIEACAEVCTEAIEDAKLKSIHSPTKLGEQTSQHSSSNSPPISWTFSKRTLRSIRPSVVTPKLSTLKECCEDESTVQENASGNSISSKSFLDGNEPVRKLRRVRYCNENYGFYGDEVSETKCGLLTTTLVA